ncbi:ATP phosphoribosyltransferase regulatory subunit [Clostridium acetobutylicum]|uniref:ATP phosphoribosyltransferase regulatory subunit n=1 Tax=Clostridium acetobutylicum (strain ATCC 824 / DSM 792 / JCM 1419 / IAM 19013 / LMG 5710 / NBRC 13948 / NRRL B-527 / VKM B-1787 / 2291 / W) TaxID=272562 RepID=HISZ_CLOAB|nr:MULTISPECIES: ATP phosphoribosyltransferase regulatory subunit [Clostridium]Q97KI4.1 RecName: Full=ATP phosphoribosyltransferase regulatory subunit [Clostridium acetobutylicum ATCC 824]AAK78911.1 Histidyl-tRNA synthetase [Clostridium acetobutylicum ATCC 824]ADZ19986.1 ATP phosphoribosyltransferase regulatory subunit [Clostridium acetobutylicum EA 2018]AEI33283.1 ATP phosphoribosyltransferase regulatory subunit [Clostridium acetobutylicum DSM 1731]AWV80630.1 ATP phosphoribosyltransferase reg
MINLKKYIPEGSRDILFEECTIKNNIENILRNSYINVGYEEVRSPTLEFYDVYNLENQPISQEKMYKLFDNTGRILVLRPDMTTPIARICATKLKNRVYPLKLSYTGNIYRMNKALNGKISEITQSGIEILGFSSLKADAEVIITAIKAILKTGLKNFKIEIGQVEFFKSIISDTALKEQDTEKLRNFIENKNFSKVEEFILRNSDLIGETSSKVLMNLPNLFGGKEVIEKAEQLTSNKQAIEALKKVRDLYDIVKRAGFGEYILIDLGMVQHINYYTGLIFRGYAHGIGDDLLSGGRYDKLLGQFGYDIPATGLAINVDNLVAALDDCVRENLYSRDRYVVFASSCNIEKAYEAVSKLNSEGKRAEVSLFDNIEETKKYCIENKISKIFNADTGKTIVEENYYGQK